MMKNKSKLRCKNCGNVWEYKGEKSTAACPLCGKVKDARDRSDYSRRYLLLHPERKDKLKEWLKTHGQEHWHTTSERLRQSVFAIVSKSTIPRCANCGCDDIRLLELNHKNGGGGQEYKKGKNTMAVYRDIAMLRRNTDDLELLCRVCNARHYLEMKYGKLPLEVIWRGKS